MQDLAPVSSRTLAGHLGHLTTEQTKTLQEFKDKLAKEGYYEPANEAEGKEASHEDVELVRFLRARKFDIPSAFSQMSSAEDWRRTNKISQLYETFPLPEFEQAAALYPRWTGQRTHEGLPVYVFKVSALEGKKTDEYQKAGEKRMEERMVALYEHMVQFVVPVCDAAPHAHPETPISGCATIVDISSVSLRRFWQLKDHMQRASVLASARYAETLGAIYLVGAPGFFSVVWGWIKKWFDPGTVDKIHILPASPSSVLEILTTHMPVTSIPKVYGGGLDWTFDSPGPLLDAGLRDVMGLKEGETCPSGPVRWVKKEGRVKVVGEGRGGVDEVTEGVKNL
ncbi:hypothetical protein JCM8547_007519 [Rhodosporidiobolus lusitaniae]